ncbi:MAG: chlorophyll synthesis pathway protein BchC [Pseudomonadota bacterium]
MQATAVILEGAQHLHVDQVRITEPGDGQAVVDILYSGISTGTEKLFWSGDMPPFPGMGYPLVPGYEALGQVAEAPRGSGLNVGDAVFVPGASCYRDQRGLFGAAASRVVVDTDRITRVDAGHGAEGALLALAATARHALAGLDRALPELIVGHGTLGRLLARLTVAAGGDPVVWETDPTRRDASGAYRVCAPEDDARRDYRTAYDASGDVAALDQVIMRMAKGSEVVLAGFYAQPVAFAFAPAFMRETRLRIAAEWTPEDLVATRDLVETGVLSLSGLITHEAPATDAGDAYLTAFTDPACLKMMLNWRPS